MRYSVSLAMYSPEVLDHFQHPRNTGELPDADARVHAENPVCGDVLELSVRMRSGVIEAIRFRAKGCVPAMACGSLITELSSQKSAAAALAIRREDIVRAIGGLPEASGHAAQLAIDALRAVLERATPNE
jgi:nitrogen fixation protein NifU and related proteins